MLNNPQRDAVIDELEAKLKTPAQHTRMLTWEELRQIPKDLISFGSHTQTHSNLVTLTADAVRSELKESYQSIKQELGISPISLAYPNGQYTEQINQIAKEEGYKILYTCNATTSIVGNSGQLYHRNILYNKEYWKNRIKMYLYGLK